MSQQETGGQAGQQTHVDVGEEQQALHEEAQQAEAAFAGAAGEPGAAGAIESEADAPLSAGQTQTAGDTGGETGGGGEGAGGGREYEEPSTGQMLASELGSEPSMQWESKIAEKLSGSGGETTGTEKT